MSIIRRIGDKCFEAVQALPEPVRPRVRPRRATGGEQAAPAPTEQGLDGVWRPIGQAAEQVTAPRPRVFRRRAAEAAQGNPAPRTPAEKLMEVACPAGPIDRLLPMAPAIPGALVGGGLAPERPLAPPPAPPAFIREAAPYSGPVIHANIPGIGPVPIPIPGGRPYTPDLTPTGPLIPPDLPLTPTIPVGKPTESTPVPEPSSLALLGAGAAALAGAVLRRRRKEQPAESHRARVEETPKDSGGPQR